MAGLLAAYEVEHQAHGMYTWRNLLMSQVADQLPTWPGIVQALEDRQLQKSLMRQMPQEFVRWMQLHWKTLGRNLLHWQTLIQHPQWGPGCWYGLALLLPMTWEWHIQHSLTQVKL